MSGPIVLTFAWPAEDTSLNSRKHWAAKRPAMIVNTYAGDYAAREAHPEHLPMNGKYTVVYTFFPPTRRRYDLDNMLARMKAHQDGFCSAWQIDDSRIRRITLEWGAVEKPGRVVVIIEALD